MILETKKLRVGNKTIFEKVTMSTAFRRTPKLFSENEACFLFLTKGAFQFRTPGHLLSFNSGDAMLAKCGNYFIEQVSVNNEAGHEVIEALGAYFYPEMVRHFFQTDLSIKTFKDNFDASKLNIEPLLKSFLDSINYVIDNPLLSDENLVVNKLKELLIILSKSEKSESVQAFVSSLFVPYEYDFNEIIQQNLYANLTLTELAYLCNCSLATFKRKFTEIYQESPAKFILAKKLEKANGLLRLGSKSIADTAYECGFDSVSNFSRAFKKQFSITPSELRLSRFAH